MARQRFIWPSIWADKVFGELKHEEQVLFIGLCSLADDEGRILADPAYLRAHVFTYRDYSAKKVRAIRDSVVTQMPSVHLYDVGGGQEAIALLKWSEYQKPKYPTPSKIPPPLPESSGNPSEDLGEGSPMGWVGLVRDSEGRAVEPSATPREPQAEQPPDFPIPDKALRAIEGGAAA